MVIRDNTVRRIEMPDGDVCYFPRVRLPSPDSTLLARLIAESIWRQEEIVLWGKRLPQPRLVAWYGDENHSYTYSGITLHPLAWSPLLLELRQMVEEVAEFAFNSVLLNLYRNQRDSMGFHSDDEPELGRHPVIASVSLGDSRQLVMKHRLRKDVRPIRLDLDSGSMLLMRGDTQSFWKHGIEKQSRPCGPRVNLTFRRIIRR